MWPVSKVIDRNADFMPAGVEWVKDRVAEFDPAANTVVTAGGQRIAYDCLVVAVGTHQDWALIDGMDVKAIGQNGLTSVYPSSDAAVATWAAMDAFRKTGGKAVLTLPSTALKCAGATHHALRAIDIGARRPAPGAPPFPAPRALPLWCRATSSMRCRRCARPMQ